MSHTAPGAFSSFTAEDLERVNQAVRQAESATRAEIVPVVARCSGRYDRAEDMIGLWTAGLTMLVVWWVYPLPSSEGGDWDRASPVWQIVALLLAGLAGFLLGAFAGTRIETLRRLFTPAAQMREEVEARARAVFFDQRVHHTQRGAGLLLYVSLYERRAAAVADRSVLEQLGKAQLDELCGDLTRRLHDRSVVEALCETIQIAGQRLAVALPAEAGNPNELADALVLIE